MYVSSARAFLGDLPRRAIPSSRRSQSLIDDWSSPVYNRDRVAAIVALQ
eukprot:IDg10154t1